MPLEHVCPVTDRGIHHLVVPIEQGTRCACGAVLVPHDDVSRRPTDAPVPHTPPVENLDNNLDTGTREC